MINESIFPCINCIGFGLEINTGQHAQLAEACEMIYDLFTLHHVEAAAS